MYNLKRKQARRFDKELLLSSELDHSRSTQNPFIGALAAAELN